MGVGMPCMVLGSTVTELERTSLDKDSVSCFRMPQRL
jgi:hypothetical protein